MKKSNVILKNQNGISTIDCVLSIVIIVMILGTILAIYNNILVNIKIINRRTEATRIIVNVAENIDAIYYENFEEEYNNLAQNENGEHYFIGVENNKLFNTEISAGYTLFLNELEDSNKIELRIEYTVNGEKQNISLVRILNKEGT